MENQLIVTLKVDDLKNIINECLKHATAQKSTEKEDETLLKREDVAEYFQVCVDTITDWTNEGKLTKYTIGNRTYYKKHEVMAALICHKKYNRK
jgi:hypothetical protein